MDANEMAALVACFGESLAGNVASVASPTRNTLKSFDRFWYPAVVRQKHMSVAYPTSRTWRTLFFLRKSRSGVVPLRVVDHHVVRVDVDVLRDRHRQVPEPGPVELRPGVQPGELLEVIDRPACPSTA